ncbi:hypothetical protein FLP10_03695 [Agromyces intestinalis]|uniref:Uncharacterized protein n=1 Tax=Agromyces intestinalis TaxID=2592652 RepID=A0A5C1YC13_9MICO|nr:hypothetical protein [Agromyces intestinalis]QEO13624.1 hypothetical protein FLP10_03695 [Agromyces intestinalis]
MTLIDDAPARLAAPPRDLLDSLAGPIDAADLLPADALGDRFDAVQGRIRDWLRHWDAVSVPAFAPVREVHPAAERRSSLVAPATRTDGAARFTASIYDPPTRVGAPLAWSRNWVSVVRLPEAVEDGRLHYRFAVGSRLVLDGQAETSLVSTSVHFGAVASARTASPFDVAGFRTPLARPLVGVQAREDADADASQTFEGSLDVRAGDTPALAFVLGVDVLMRDGWIRVHDGSSSWVGPAGAGATGSIETRFTPAPLLAMFA